MGAGMMLLLLVLLFIVFPIILSGIKVIKEYERAVIFRLGRLKGARGPGIFYVIPLFQHPAELLRKHPVVGDYERPTLLQ